MLRIVEVDNPKRKCSFIDFAHDHYATDPHYVPELYIAQRDHLDPSKNPYFDNAKAALFLAESNGKVLGRIAVVDDVIFHRHAERDTGVFGFFESIDDERVSTALLDTASKWLASRGLKAMEGPYHFSTNHSCGLLVDGFGHAPSLMMPYNKDYYARLLEQYGLQKKTDVLAYRIQQEDFPERLRRSLPMLEDRFSKAGIKVRPINLRQFESDVRMTLDVYNQAWSANAGFAPMTDREYLHAAKDMKLIMDPELVLLAEKDGKCVGFSLTLPDANQVFRKIKRGRLLPTGIFHLLFGRRNISSVRILALGVLEKYRRMGIDAYFYARTFEYVNRHPSYRSGEASWILEDNAEMNNAILKMGGQEEKRYRFYRMPLR
ncbi:MAG: hypothetical protein KBF37_11815 [Saprospiraceae bacterium]|jgi:GNAT superfamily N-acetyltransferase|nr:hypothetical protein [Saprospiraceae bacterium]MBP9210994.1 hypothetical protein [Saprospiraceae bacterium]MBV6474198.1 hypothetical protein [Saprospiraceae bacterium]